MSVYADLAGIISKRIEHGFYKKGQRLPSLRYLSEEYEVSLGTVQKAYNLLEDKGLIEPKPRSGYFVRRSFILNNENETLNILQEPVSVPKWSSILDLTFPSPSSDTIQLGRGLPNVENQSIKPLLTALSKAWVSPDSSALYYDEIQGVEKLREQISRIMLDSETKVTPDELIITPGCHAALSIAIKSVCQKGDVVVTDSPCFHGIINSLREIGIKVIEIASSNNQGMSIEALELALEQWDVKAILITPNCNNPLGYIMPDERKSALYKLAQRADVAIIEDDIYGELAYKAPRPRTIKSFDTDGRVLLCSSFSKMIAPGLRVGWIAPGRYLEKAFYQKYASAHFLSSAPQRALVQFIESGFYLVHVKRMRNLYAKNLEILKNWIFESFPKQIKISSPQGGYILWIELPRGVSGRGLAKRLKSVNIQISTGCIFSASNKYENCIRLNYGTIHIPGMRNAVFLIGKQIKLMMLESN